MKKLLLTFFSIVAVSAAVIGLRACGNGASQTDGTTDGETQNTVVSGSEIKEAITLETAYLTASELGYNGNISEFSASVSTNGTQRDIKSVAQAANGDLIVYFTDGSYCIVANPTCKYNYGSWKTVSSATCTSIGYQTRICDLCGDWDYLFTPATGHRTDYKVSLFNQSIHSYECSRCHEGINEEHDLNEENVCTVCGYEVDYTLDLYFTKIQNGYSVRGANKSTLENVIIPATYKGLPVTEIPSNGFTSCPKLKSVQMPDSITEINNLVFGNCPELKEIKFSKNLTRLGSSVFYRCVGLEEVVFPESLTTVGPYVFRHCTALKKVTFPASWTEVPAGMFYGCTGMIELKLPENITSTGKNAFSASGLKNIVIPSTVTKIDSSSFSGCKELESVVIPDSVTEIGGYAFASCTALKTVVLPKNLTIAGESIFANTAITKIELQDGTETLTGLSYCATLNELVVPDSVKNIASGALKNCTELMRITFKGTKAQWKAIIKDSGWRTEDNVITDLFVDCDDGTLEYIW